MLLFVLVFKKSGGSYLTQVDAKHHPHGGVASPKNKLEIKKYSARPLFIRSKEEKNSKELLSSATV
jgi:hypothetical protein